MDEAGPSSNRFARLALLVCGASQVQQRHTQRHSTTAREYMDSTVLSVKRHTHEMIYINEMQHVAAPTLQLCMLYC